MTNVLAGLTAPPRTLRGLLLLATLACSAGCLVLSLNPAYDDETIAWDPALIGSWTSPDDKSSIEIARGEWKSYRVSYAHPIEKGEVTGYLTILGDERFLDVMPRRGEDRGSFVVPVHAILHVRLQADSLELTPLSYDWFLDRIRTGEDVTGLPVALDQKENILVLPPTDKLRTWLRTQPVDGAMFGSASVFTRRR